MNFSEQLRRQLRLLERSCNGFDDGALEEALRIAVCLRILLHDTGKGTSLLTHLDIKCTTKLLTTFEPAWKEDSQTGWIAVYTPVWLSQTGSRKPPLGDAPRREFILVGQWWDEVVMARNNKLARKDVILSAANQDGGAHVDANPSEKTAELVEGIGTLTIRGRDFVKTHKLDNHHFWLLRQFGYEVLNSPDLKKHVAG